MGYTILIVGTTPGDKGNQTCPSGITSSIPTYQLAGGRVQSKFDLSSLCLERQGDIRQAEMRRRDPDRSVPTGSQVPPHSLETHPRVRRGEGLGEPQSVRSISASRPLAITRRTSLVPASPL